MPGLYYEEFEAGQRFDHEWTRTVTEMDNVLFSTLTMNVQPLHIDAHFSANTEFGKPIVNSLFTLGLVIGMVPYEVGALVKIIYYEYNRSEIRRVASKDLMEIVYFLKDNPSASVELDSYTDARGGAKYNQRLSQMRADAAVAGGSAVTR